MKGFLSTHTGCGLEEHLTLRTDVLLLIITKKLSTLLFCGSGEEDILVLLDVKYVREIRHTGLEAMLIWVMVLDESSEAGFVWKGVFMYMGTGSNPSCTGAF